MSCKEQLLCHSYKNDVKYECSGKKQNAHPHTFKSSVVSQLLLKQACSPLHRLSLGASAPGNWAQGATPELEQPRL